MYSTLLIGHKKYPGEQRVCCWPFKDRQLQKSNRQDMVMVRPPGIDKGGFQLRIGNVWFCKVLFLFSFVSQNDQKRQQHDCAFVSVLEEYKGRRRPGCMYLHTFYLYAYFTYPAYICLQVGLKGWTRRWSMSARATSKCCMFCPSHPSCPSSHWFQWGTLERSLSACGERLQTLTVGPVT